MASAGRVFLAGNGVNQQQVFSSVILFLGQGQSELRNAPQEIFTAQDRENMPALFAGSGIRFVQGRDAVVLVGFFELFGKIVINRLLNPFQLTTAF